MIQKPQHNLGARQQQPDKALLAGSLTARWIRRALVAISVAITALVVLGPWVLYEVSLSKVEGRPTRPAIEALSIVDKEEVWKSFKERGPVDIQALTPHAYILAFLDDQESTPGAHVAWFVARNHNYQNLLDRRMIWWHLSGAALTIWLTRNWNTDQLLAKAAEIRRARMQPSDPALEQEPDDAASP